MWVNQGPRFGSEWELNLQVPITEMASLGEGRGQLSFANAWGRGQLSHACGEGQGHLSRVQELALPLGGGARSALLLLCPAKARARYPRFIEGLGNDMVPIIPCGYQGHRHRHRPQLQQEHGPRHALGNISDNMPGHHHGLSGAPGHLELYSIVNSKASRYQHGLRWLSGPWVSTQPPVTTGA